MVELVTKPFVRIVASSRFDDMVLSEFIDEHGLNEFVDVPENEFAVRTDTPIGNITSKVGMAGESELDLLSEFSGRFCYRSWDKGRSTEEYLANVISEAHGNVLAHGNVSFIVTGVSRSLTHELVRHHVGTNPSQESQRYVTADGGEIEILGFKKMRAVVPPMFLHHHEQAMRVIGKSNWLTMFQTDFDRALAAYHDWLHKLKLAMPDGLAPTIKKKRAQEAARCFLPNAAETRLVWTMNMRSARNVIEQRGNEHADLEIRRLAVGFTHELKRVAPATFFDADIYTADDGFEAVRVKHSKV